MYEDLRITYSSVREVKFASPGGLYCLYVHTVRLLPILTLSLLDVTTRVTVLLREAPKIGDQLALTENNPLELFVEIRTCDMPRLEKALKHRGLVRLALYVKSGQE